MSKKILSFPFLLLIIIALGCDAFEPVGPQRGISNPQADIETESIKFNIRHLTSSEEWQYFPAVNVDITTFRKVDSVRFAANMRSQMYTEKCIVELYDFTNKRAVLNSTVDSNVRYYFKYVESSNLLPYFPLSEALMGIRIRSSKEGNPVEVAYDSEIIIYSH